MKKTQRMIPELKAKIIEGSMKEGCVLADYARTQNITPKQLYVWRYEYLKSQRDNEQSTNFVEAKVDIAKVIQKKKGILKKVSFGYDEFTISLEGSFDISHVNKIIQMVG